MPFESDFVSDENQPDAECRMSVNFAGDEINGDFFTIFKLSHEEHQMKAKQRKQKCVYNDKLAR